jgi:two-component system KDP operon response regulator KdpE
MSFSLYVERLHSFTTSFPVSRDLSLLIYGFGTCFVLDYGRTVNFDGAVTVGARLHLRKANLGKHPLPPRVLIIDDDSSLRQALRVSLSASGYMVDEAPNAEEGIRMISRKAIDLVLLDANMPGIGGVGACESIRVLRPGTGILFLTVQDEQEFIVAALEAGADDCISKPFGFGELVARMRAVERRIRPEEPAVAGVIRIGQLEMDLNRRTLKKAGCEVPLSLTEFRLLACLMQHRGVSLSYSKILRAVWGPDYTNELESLRTYCKLLRKKIEDDPNRPQYLVTERAIGYRLQDPSNPHNA